MAGITTFAGGEASLADAVRAVAAVAGEVQVEVIVMMPVGVRSQHGGELAAGAVVHGVEERLLST